MGRTASPTLISRRWTGSGRPSPPGYRWPLVPKKPWCAGCTVNSTSRVTLPEDALKMCPRAPTKRPQLTPSQAAPCRHCLRKTQKRHTRCSLSSPRLSTFDGFFPALGSGEVRYGPGGRRGEGNCQSNPPRLFKPKETPRLSGRGARGGRPAAGCTALHTSPWERKSPGWGVRRRNASSVPAAAGDGSHRLRPMWFPDSRRIPGDPLALGPSTTLHEAVKPKSQTSCKGGRGAGFQGPPRGFQPTFMGVCNAETRPSVPGPAGPGPACKHGHR